MRDLNAMLFRIYTKTGDAGDTSLACGSRIPKDDLRVDAYGTIDELSSVLGVVGAEASRFLPIPGASESSCPWVPEVMEHIEWVQDRLFTLASMLATVNLPSSTMPVLQADDIAVLEEHIDRLELDLPQLRNFILPGGSPVVSYLHLARTVCRRAERVTTSLSKEETLNSNILPFLNRLSDDLFVLARWVAYQQGEPEKLWIGRKRPQKP